MTTDGGVYAPDWAGFEWGPWLSLHPDADAINADILTTNPGLYRVRHPAYDGLVYIGETGASLSGRIHALRRGVFDELMPFSDPHTASPALWAIYGLHGPGLEVSATSPAAATDYQQRKAIEDALIAIHRRDTGTNLVGNHGRMPPGYSKSKKRETGSRGERTDDAMRSFQEGTAPLSWENPSAITARDWMGLEWSAPVRLRETTGVIPSEGGVYRLWTPEATPPLEYIGESVSLSSRLDEHRRERDGTLYVSYAVLPELTRKFQYSQIESDLLGAHWLACGLAPKDQY